MMLQRRLSGLSKVLTGGLFFSLSVVSFAKTQNQALTEEKLNTFTSYVESIRQEDRKKLFGDNAVPSTSFQFARGGWNGSGGGGGLACFEDESALLTALDSTKNISSEQVKNIKKWILLDLFDSPENPDWPQGNFDPIEFLRKRIHARIGPSLPVTASYLLKSFGDTVRMPWSDMLMMGVRVDAGPMASGKKWPKECGYMQWALRQQNTTTKEPFFMLLINRHLDNHLRKILSEREYRIQQAILFLHESIYAILKHEGHVDSAQVRSIIDFILMPEHIFNRHLFNDKVNATFWSMWGREAFELVIRSSHLFSEGLQKDLSDSQRLRWGVYVEFLKKLHFVIKEINIAVSRRQLPQMQSIPLASHLFPDHNIVLYSIVFPMMATVRWGENGDMPIQDEEALYLIAAELEGQKKIESLQDLVLQETSSAEWKRICASINDLSIRWARGPDSSEVDFHEVKKWMANKAVRFCKARKILSE